MVIRRSRRQREEATDGGDRLVHVIFPLEVDEGWPPVTAERVWARPLGGDRYKLENVPWFALGVSEGDIVRAVAPRRDQWPVVTEREQWNGNCTIRVIPLSDGSLRGSQGAVLDLFTRFGVTGEGAGVYPIVALTVPPDVDIGAVKELLIQGERDGRWEYEEACVGDTWRSL